MKKLEMAHDYAMKLVGNPTTPLKDMNSIIGASWKYADLMQAEADKREDKTRPAVLSGSAHPTVMSMNEFRDACVKPNLEEWQPDWSQAPRDDIVAWKMKDETQPIWVAADGGYYLAPTFGYTGRWQDSLRKRPE